MRWVAAWACVILLALVLCETGLRLIGLGTPVLYEVSPDVGYRPQPNQNVHRFHGAVVRINNLGLRALRDWDTTTADKVLFLGNSVTYGGSYVTTADLFSERSMRAGGSWIPGDGGVNAWGVDNIYGLIVKRGFQPAQVYVTVLIETDFYRGLSAMPVTFRTTRPRLAILEAIPHARVQVAARLGNYPPADKLPGARLRAESAVVHLKEMDDLLRARGKLHLIYLSPYLTNLTGTAPRDTLLVRLFSEHGLRIAYLQDRPELRSIPADSLPQLYHDDAHLSPRGHAVWASMLGADLAREIGSDTIAKRPARID